MRKTLITWFGCGDMPFAPGTWGSGGALIFAGVWYGACRVAAAPPWLFHAGLLAGVAAASVLSILWGAWAIAALANHPNSRKEGDPGAFVLDEVAGQWLSLFMLPLSTWPHAFTIAAAQFVLFRIFDVIKPPPGRVLERLPGGWGILLDDLSSALYANVIGQTIFRLWLEWT